MEENEKVNENTPNEEETVEEFDDSQEEEIEETTPEEPEESESSEEIIARLEKENKTLKIQKAKAREKAPATKTIDGEIPQSDLIAILKADVSQEDIPEVIDYAKLKGISVAKALETGVVKAILKESAEKRKVANATNTGKARPSSSKLSDTELLSNSKKGLLPESDIDMQRLVKLQQQKD